MHLFTYSVYICHDIPYAWLICAHILPDPIRDVKVQLQKKLKGVLNLAP